MMGSRGQQDISVLKESLFKLSELDPDETQGITTSILREIEKSESIDLHYTGHAKEQTIRDTQLLLLIAAMQDVDLSRLQVLNLSGCILEDQKIIIMLSETVLTMDLPALRYLDLSGHYTLTEAGSASIASALKSGHFRSLQHLGLPRCNIGDMVDAIQAGNIWELEELIFSGRDPIEESDWSSNIHELFRAGYMTQIKKLVLKGQTIDSSGMVSLARALHGHPENNLQTLDLSSNNIGVAGSIALARLIEDGNLISLRHFRFSSCRVDGEQMETIVQGIESGQLLNLELLDVSWNKFKDQGALALARAIQAGHLAGLRRLNLGYCEIGTEFRLQHGILAVLEALGEGLMPHLEWLNLLGNHIAPAAATAVANTVVEILEMMPALRFVNLFDSRRGNEALRHALDLVLKYPESDFTAVHSGLKRKTQLSLCQRPNAINFSKQRSCPQFQYHEERKVLLSAEST